jgi:hypothetical protein
MQAMVPQKLQESYSQKSIKIEKLTLKWKKKQMLNGLYVVINQLIKSIRMAIHLIFFLLYMLGETISIQKKLIKIGTFENKAQIWSFKSP